MIAFMLLVVVGFSHIYKCNHDDLQLLVPIVDPLLAEERPKVRLLARQRIRMFINTYYIDNIVSSVTCTASGQYKSWGGGTYACTSDDVMTVAKKHALLESLENLKEYVQDVISVDPVTNSFSLNTHADYPLPSNVRTTDGKTDYYLTIYPRPFGASSSTLASATCWPTSPPRQGMMNVNLAVVPNSAQSFETKTDRQFFEVLFHELCHALGISSSMFSRWINPSTGGEWGLNLPLYEINNHAGWPRKTFKILSTPKLHELMKERWGVEYFEDNPSWRVGVEVEDYGGSGTAGSHWEGRTFYTEVMTGITYGYGRISDITFTALEDTGWYSVNYSKSEILEWGNWKSIINESRSNYGEFGTGAPGVSWPPYYVAQSASDLSSTSSCTFDYRAGGVTYSAKRGTCSNTNNQCAYPGFYDATNLEYYGSPPLDYILAVTPYSDRICRDDPGYVASNYGMSWGESSYCAVTTLAPNSASSKTVGCYKMRCDNRGVIVTVNNEDRVCTSKDQQMTFTGMKGVVFCPDPRVLCGIIGISESSGFSSISSDLYSVEAQSTTNLTSESISLDSGTTHDHVSSEPTKRVESHGETGSLGKPVSVETSLSESVNIWTIDKASRDSQIHTNVATFFPNDVSSRQGKEPASTIASQNPTGSSRSDDKSLLVIVVSASVGLVIVTVAIVIGIMFCRKEKKRTPPPVETRESASE
jgi:hypothetical protein